MFPEWEHSPACGKPFCLYLQGKVRSFPMEGHSTPCKSPFVPDALVAVALKVEEVSGCPQPVGDTLTFGRALPVASHALPFLPGKVRGSRGSGG